MVLVLFLDFFYFFIKIILCANPALIVTAIVLDGAFKREKVLTIKQILNDFVREKEDKNSGKNALEKHSVKEFDKKSQ
ncbi:hypothetical protein EHP00_471 [Ecytonucleospora hepatopenaei]|uniref:Uncharacterized protein n=1 Tax=Ecytonucleospora hepatopenaei TaxID=646526 RepID=A0A1W0E930_9MICR|nr:hypothetical protein EHP00_471 [Ecytonucleospora hepatopenaei]